MLAPVPNYVEINPAYSEETAGCQCNACRHNWRDKPGATCAAFPDGIPRDILLGRADHHAAYPGDHGIRFEAVR